MFKFLTKLKDFFSIKDKTFPSEYALRQFVNKDKVTNSEWMMIMNIIEKDLTTTKLTKLGMKVVANEKYTNDGIFEYKTIN